MAIRCRCHGRVQPYPVRPGAEPGHHLAHAACWPSPAAAINPGVRYLHDGRAVTLEQAILWHGGQTAAARVRHANLAAQDRAVMVEFLESL